MKIHELKKVLAAIEAELGEEVNEYNVLIDVDKSHDKLFGVQGVLTDSENKQMHITLFPPRESHAYTKNVAASIN